MHVDRQGSALIAACKAIRRHIVRGKWEGEYNILMTIPLPAHSSRGLQILKTVLYILAGLVLVLGLLTGISLITSADNLATNAVLPFQLFGGGATPNLLASMFSGFLINLGIVILLLSLVFSLLLYGVGRLVGRMIDLEARLARLEGRA
jgi:hypothetical protein